MLRDLFNSVTGRTATSDPHLFGLEVITGRWGQRTVRDPRLAELLEARRRHALTYGLDGVDQALARMDPGVAEALAATAARMSAQQAGSRAGPLARVSVRV